VPSGLRTWAELTVGSCARKSHCRYPVGYFLFWQTGAEGVDTKVIGDTNKQKSPSLL